MPAKTRKITAADVAKIIAVSNQATDRQAVYKAVEAVAAETCGFVFLTTLRHDEAQQVVVRLHSSDEKSYPIGGTKPINKITASHSMTQTGEVFLAADKEQVKAAFFDHELIFSLGATAILNSPIRYAGRHLGTLNFSGVSGTYGPDEVQAAKILAGLLVPTVLAEMK